MVFKPPDIQTFNCSKFGNNWYFTDTRESLIDFEPAFYT